MGPFESDISVAASNENDDLLHDAPSSLSSGDELGVSF